jgi:hypothetical protein
VEEKEKEQERERGGGGGGGGERGLGSEWKWGGFVGCRERHFSYLKVRVGACCYCVSPFYFSV